MKESPKKCEKLIFHEDIFEHHPTVIRGIIMQRLNQDFEEEDLILGVDPGQRQVCRYFIMKKKLEAHFILQLKN